MERCSGFTIPQNGVFYALHFEESLARFDILSGKAEVIEDGELEVDDHLSVFKLDDIKYPFVGYSGTHSLHRSEGFGYLSLLDSNVVLTNIDGSTSEWQFENFSGDWEQVTFDLFRDAFLFGAPYDFDFRYVEITAKKH